MKHENHSKASYPKAMDDFELDDAARTMMRAGQIRADKKKWPVVEKRMKDMMKGMKHMMGGDMEEMEE